MSSMPLRHARRPQRNRIARRIVGAFAVMLALLIFLTGSVAADPQTRVGKLRIDGAITPVMATYVGRGIDRAADRGDHAVIIEMDTPGGLSSAMDDIVSDILNSHIPVIVWVAPDGARAASAGVYITYAAHVAAMSPATNIGSATPVQIGNDGQASETPTAMDRKIVNDAVAKIRSLAELRGRNGDWAEDAVRDAANVRASEADKLGVIDFIAATQDDLLQQADGMTVAVAGQQVTLTTADAQVETIDMSFFERLLQVLTDPNIAYILLSLGSLAIIFEIANPGGIGPGAIGVILLLGGFYGLGTINSNWAGLALMILAFVLFALDVFLTTHGVLTISGVGAFLFGSLLLSNTRNPDVLNVSRSVIFAMTAMVALFFVFVVSAVIRIRKKPAVTGTNAMVGTLGVARTNLRPTGMVFIFGELWQARSEIPVEAGESVRVIAIDGLELHVAPAELESGSTPPVSPSPHPSG